MTPYDSFVNLHTGCRLYRATFLIGFKDKEHSKIIEQQASKIGDIRQLIVSSVASIQSTPIRCCELPPCI